MNIFNWRPKTITLDDQKSVLMGRRNPVTGQSVLMIETDAESHRKFIAEYVAALKPDGMVEIQLAQRLAQDTWRINRIHAVEENIFAAGHSEKFANIQSAHPEIHAAMVQALTFRNDPKLFSYLATYEQKLTKNFHVNFNLLLKLQSLRQPVLAREKTMTAAA
jgi:cyclopropane fatty-acyl-phospholipid synthase-like methyltransferase